MAIADRRTRQLIRPYYAQPILLTWQQSTGDNVKSTLIRRTMWYSVASLWYCWDYSTWLDYAGFEWALDHIRSETRAALGPAADRG